MRSGFWQFGGLSLSDAAIQLDLIAKVRGIVVAESFFFSLSDTSKDRRIYGALLNAYVRGKMKQKAESLLDQKRTKGYASHSLPLLSLIPYSRNS